MNEGQKPPHQTAARLVLTSAQGGSVTLFPVDWSGPWSVLVQLMSPSIAIHKVRKSHLQDHNRTTQTKWCPNVHPSIFTTYSLPESRGECQLSIAMSTHLLSGHADSQHIRGLTGVSTLWSTTVIDAQTSGLAS